LPYVDDVQVVLDVGGNCGASAVHFARAYPDAQVHSFEPGSHQRQFLDANATRYDNITVHPVAVSDEDGVAVLYGGIDETGKSSLHQSEWTNEHGEEVTVRSLRSWAAEHRIDRADVIKVDVEGLELAVLRGAGDLIANAKVLYLEYDSRHDRRAIDALLAGSHELLGGKIFLDQGEVVYIANAIAETDAPTDHLRELLLGSVGG
jgi:FkbM family methyltransferase